MQQRYLQQTARSEHPDLASRSGHGRKEDHETHRAQISSAATLAGLIAIAPAIRKRIFSDARWHRANRDLRQRRYRGSGPEAHGPAPRFPSHILLATHPNGEFGQSAGHHSRSAGQHGIRDLPMPARCSTSICRMAITRSRRPLPAWHKPATSPCILTPQEKLISTGHRLWLDRRYLQR